MRWIKKLLGINADEGSQRKTSPLVAIESEDGEVSFGLTKEHGQVDGRHYTDCVELVKEFKRQGRHAEAIELLLKTIDATERESKEMSKEFGHWGVAPWYYEHLAIIYRKEGRIEDEIEILERYERQKKAAGVGPGKLKLRLEKAKALLKAKPNKI